MRTTSDARLRWTLIAAIGAHAMAFVVATRLAERATLEPPPSATGATETSIEVEPLPAPPEATAPTEPSRDEAPPPPAGAALVPHEDRVATASSRRDRASSLGSTTEPAAPTAPASSGDSTWSFSPTTTPPPAPGLSNHAFDDATHAGVNQAVAESIRQEAARPKPSSVLPRYTPSDMALGLVPGGAVAALSRDLVRRSLVPDESRAVLQFDTDGAGVVSSIRVLEASSGRAEWIEVAAQIAADAKSRPLKVPVGARGLVVTLEVTSAMKTANGTSPNDSALKKAWGAINDPMAAATNVPPTRVVASRIVNVQTL